MNTDGSAFYGNRRIAHVMTVLSTAIDGALDDGAGGGCSTDDDLRVIHPCNVVKRVFTCWHFGLRSIDVTTTAAVDHTVVTSVDAYRTALDEDLGPTRVHIFKTGDFKLFGVEIIRTHSTIRTTAIDIMIDGRSAIVRTNRHRGITLHQTGQRRRVIALATAIDIAHAITAELGTTGRIKFHLTDGAARDGHIGITAIEGFGLLIGRTTHGSYFATAIDTGLHRTCRHGHLGVTIFYQSTQNCSGCCVFDSRTHTAAIDTAKGVLRSIA